MATFDPAHYPDYSIFRVLELGDDEAVAWLRETFPEAEIRRVLMAERRLSPKSATFWALVYGIPEGQVAALAPRVIEFMDGSAAERTWHRETITAGTEATLIGLREAGLLDGAYLAGGTGLALQFGHRLSRDLDFFVPELFDEDMLVQRFQMMAGFALVAKAPRTLHATI